jgi:hypothetical protein
VIKKVLVSVLVLGLAGTALAQAPAPAPKGDPQKAKQAETVTDKAAAEVKAIREDIQKDRNALVAVAMQLSDKDAAIFWPLYAEYRAAINKASGERAGKLILDYALAAKTLTDEQAAKLMTEFFAIRKADTETKAAWFPKFSQKLSPKVAARFFQVDNKLDAIVQFQLAAEIPLVQ